ncbi:hypothetical protein DFH08DRAFT_855412, partial [Mycena albidolilacea]
MHYGEPVIRRSVPLAIGLVSVSNSQLPILDTLSKYSHDNGLAVHCLCDGARWCGNQQRAAGTDATTACGVLLQRARLSLYGTDRAGARASGQGHDWSKPLLLQPEHHESASNRWPPGDADGLHRCQALHPRQIPLDAVLPRHRYVPPLFDHCRRGAEQQPGHRARRTGRRSQGKL